VFGRLLEQTMLNVEHPNALVSLCALFSFATRAEQPSSALLALCTAWAGAVGRAGRARTAATCSGVSRCCRSVKLLSGGRRL